MRKGTVINTRLDLSNSYQQKTFDELCDEFMKRLSVQGLSPQTIKTYGYHIKYFKAFLGENVPCQSITDETLIDYVVYLQNTHEIKTITIETYLHNLSPIIKYGIKRRYISTDVKIPSMRYQHETKEIYTQEELNALLAPPKDNDFITLRTYTMIWTLSSTAIRARELRELKVGNVNLVERQIIVNQTKNKKPRVIPISAALFDVLQKYMEIRGGEADKYLFPSIYDDILAMSSLQKQIKDYANSRGVKKTSLHLFRHTFITNAVNSGVSPLILQRITGHSTMKQLSNYYNARVSDIAQVIDDITPKNNSRKKQFK